VVQVQLLGGVSASSDAGCPLEVGPAKCQAVLATLALSVGEAVTVARLMDVLWGEDLPVTADKTLQGYIARLRKNLGAESIIRAGSAYRLDLDADRVDVARFRRLITSGDVDRALAVWTGDPWSGVRVPGLAAASDGLVEQWLSAVEDQLGRRVVTDADSAIAPLAELTAAHPFREELWALLMAALYRVGRQADALAAFQRVRAHLIDELGVEPGPRLRELERQILDHDPALVHGPAPSATGADPASPSGRVPAPPTGTVTFGFVQVADATRLWADHRRSMPRAMSRLDTVVRSVSSELGGTVLVAVGESFGVAFQRAGDAADWAERLQLEAAQEPWPGDVEVRLTVALHTGETVEHDGAYFGPAVHTASRLAAAGHPGQTLVSSVTAALLARHDLRDLGTHRLEGVVADHDIRQLDEGDHPPLRTSLVVSGNLPRRLRQLLGRDDELDLVAEAMTQSPVVTLIGPGGVGKTTLALAAAHRARTDEQRRVWLVELATITDPDDVPRATAETLGVTGGDGRTLTDSIAAALRARPSLLLLDNCEHVIGGAARLARTLAQDHDTRVLATSRESLGVPGEQLLVVPPLDVEAAVELFTRGARAVSTMFDLSADHAQVAEICRQLDGLPLAIELAAARTMSLTPGELLHRLDDRLRLLDGGRRTDPQRHRTLRTTVQWSYDLLSADQQRAYEQLAVFAGPFDLAAAEAVTTDADQDRVTTDQLLGDLVERSMVIVESGPFGRRFRLLETLRQFAAEQLAARGDHTELTQRHAHWCRAEVARIGGMLTGPGEVEGVARLAELWPDLRIAVDGACRTHDQGLADALVRPIAVEGNLRRQSEIGDWAERILELLDPDDDAAVVFWLLWAGHRRAQAGDHAAWEALLERYGHRDHPVIRFNTAYLAETAEASHAASPVAVLWLRDHDEDHAADLIEIAGVASSLMTSHRFAELATLAASLAARHRDGPPTLRYFWLGMQGYAAQYQGLQSEATRYFTHATALELPAGTYRVIQTVEARMAFARGDRPHAYRVLRDNLDDLLDKDYTDVTRMVAVEYITMMAAIGRLADTAHIFGYLDTTGDFGKLARENLLVDTVRRIEAAPALAAAAKQLLDARGALRHMRDSLDGLLGADPE
jgi:predicted ATPase/DNA-binding SARP family transcriptional activator